MLLYQDEIIKGSREGRTGRERRMSAPGLANPNYSDQIRSKTRENPARRWRKPCLLIFLFKLSISYRSTLSILLPFPHIYPNFLHPQQSNVKPFPSSKRFSMFFLNFFFSSSPVNICLVSSSYINISPPWKQSHYSSRYDDYTTLVQQQRRIGHPSVSEASFPLPGRPAHQANQANPYRRFQAYAIFNIKTLVFNSDSLFLFIELKLIINILLNSWIWI